MNRSRRTVTKHLGAAMLAAGLYSPMQAALAQAWPTRPIRIVVGFAAGTPPDVFARIYGEHASRTLGVPVVIENMPGAAGNLASAAGARSAPDGYTVLYNVSSAFTINPFVYANLPFDPARDLTPVATTLRLGLVLISNPAFQARSVPEVVTLARQRPGTVSYGSYGVGAPTHLIMELFKDRTGIEMLHVPYRTTPIPDLIGGQLNLALEPVPTAIPLITGGRVRALAYSGAQRHPTMPDVPTFAETVPGLSMTSWHGIWAPAATPPAVLDRLHTTLIAASRDAEVQRRIRELNIEPLGVSRAEMGEMIRRDASLFSAIVNRRNIRVD